MRIQEGRCWVTKETPLHLGRSSRQSAVSEATLLRHWDRGHSLSHTTHAHSLRVCCPHTSIICTADLMPLHSCAKNL